MKKSILLGILLVFISATVAFSQPPKDPPPQVCPTMPANQPAPYYRASNQPMNYPVTISGTLHGAILSYSVTSTTNVTATATPESGPVTTVSPIVNDYFKLGKPTMNGYATYSLVLTCVGCPTSYSTLLVTIQCQ